LRILQVFGRFLPENGRLRLEDDRREVFHNLAENSKFPQGLRPTRAKHEFYLSDELSPAFPGLVRVQVFQPFLKRLDLSPTF
jgi:hypothetical protein